MKLHRNVRLWYLVTFFSHAAFFLPIWVIFLTIDKGFSNSYAFLLGVMSYGLSSFFEVPTGSWADRHGRVKAYRLGTFLYICSVASFVVLNNFFLLFAVQIFGAIGLSLQSGSIEALVHDSLPKKNKDVIYTKVHGKKQAILFAGRIVTVAMSGILYKFNPVAPFLATVIFESMGLLLSFLFVEVRTEEASEKSSLDHIRETWKIMMNKVNLKRFIMLIALYALVSEALFASYQPYFKSIGINIGLFGLLYALISLCSLLGSLSIAKILETYSAFAVLLLQLLTVIITLLAMTFESSTLTYLAVIPSGISFGFVLTMQNSIAQKLISSRHQATAISIANFARNSALLLSVVSVGTLLDHISAMALIFVILILALVLLPFFVLSARKQI